MALTTSLSFNSLDPTPLSLHNYYIGDTAPFRGSFSISNPAPVILLSQQAGTPARPNIAVTITLSVTTIVGQTQVLNAFPCAIDNSVTSIPYTSTLTYKYTCTGVPVNSIGSLAVPILTFTGSWTGATSVGAFGNVYGTTAGSVTNINTFVVAFTAAAAPSRLPGDLTQRRAPKPWLKQTTRADVVAREADKKAAAVNAASKKKRSTMGEVYAPQPRAADFPVVRSFPRRPKGDQWGLDARYPSLESLD